MEGLIWLLCFVFGVVALIDGSFACSERTYGQNCSEVCSDHCYGTNASCDHVTGSCDQGCEPGYQPPICKEKCSEGYYGINCITPCSTQCVGDGRCDPTYGSCVFGCQPGYVPPFCNDRTSDISDLLPWIAIAAIATGLLAIAVVALIILCRRLNHLVIRGTANDVENEVTYSEVLPPHESHDHYKQKITAQASHSLVDRDATYEEPLYGGNEYLEIIDPYVCPDDGPHSREPRGSGYEEPRRLTFPIPSKRTVRPTRRASEGSRSLTLPSQRHVYQTSSLEESSPLSQANEGKLHHASGYEEPASLTLPRPKKRGFHKTSVSEEASSLTVAEKEQESSYMNAAILNLQDNKG